MRLRYTLGILLLCGCQSAPRGVRVDTSTRCFALDIGEWSREWPAAWAPPSIVRLDTAGTQAFGGMQRWFVLEPHASLPSPRSGAGSAAWRPLGGDSIQLAWAGDFVGLQMHLASVEAGLSGWVRGHTDVAEREELLPRAPVRGRVVDCPVNGGAGA